MAGIVVFFHIIISILLVLVILMQSSKGGGLAGAFGGGGGQGAFFGGRGAATLLSKITTILAVLFMLSCISQVFLSKASVSGTQSALQEELSRRPVGTSPAASLPGLPIDNILQQGEASVETSQ